MSNIDRLMEYGFSIDDLDRLNKSGWDHRRILNAVKMFLDEGLTTTQYARETFSEAYPELFREQTEPVYQAIPAAEYGEDTVSFVWYPYIPKGDYTVLMAPGGTGKTYFVCGIAAAISTGKALPGDLAQPPGNVLIISAEDRGELLKQRLKASGADLTKVFILDCIGSEGMNFTTGYDSFKAAVQEHSPRLVVIDPWHGFLGAKIDTNCVNAVRPVFQKLANMAKELDCGLILISHVNKRSQGENANNAATGSTDFINAARSALYVLFHEEDPDQRIVVHTKTNYAWYGKSVCFLIQNGGILWTGFSDIDRKTMEEAARSRKTPGEIKRESCRREETERNLVSALLDAADPQKVQRFTYTEFAEKYGLTIFGGGQPKRALDAVADAMVSRGFAIKAGLMVNHGENTGKGFSIAKLE